MHYLPLTCMICVLMTATVTAQNQLEPTSDNEGVLGIMYVITLNDEYQFIVMAYNVTHSNIQYTGEGEWDNESIEFTGALVYGKLIYIINRWEENNLVYNPNTDVFTKISPNIIPRGAYPAVFLINSRLYVVGGMDRDYRDLASMESLSLHTLYNQDWRLEAAVLPQPTINFDGCTLGDTAIVAGGYGRSSTNHTYTWQPGQPSWSRGKDMHEARHSHCMVCAEGAAWVIGGLLETAANVKSSMERYSLDRDEWEVMASLPQHRAYQQCVYDGAGRIIVTGGYNQDWGVQNGIYIYNMAQNTWSESHPILPFHMYTHLTVFIPA